MAIAVRSYTPSDYDDVAVLYRKRELYGGQFDTDRDSETRLRKRIEADPDAIFVAEKDGEIVGSVSLIEDGRIAWLFRFAVVENEYSETIAKALFEKASEILKEKDHQQVLVYSPTGNSNLDERYRKLGFTKGNDYTCYWKNL